MSEHNLFILTPVDFLEKLNGNLNNIQTIICDANGIVEVCMVGIGYASTFVDYYGFFG
jgi:hypothetical protein